MTGIEINLIYMTFSHLKMPIYFFFKEIILGCQCATHGSALRPLQTGDQARYTNLSACQASYLRLSLNSERVLYGASMNEIKQPLLPLNVGSAHATQKPLNCCCNLWNQCEQVPAHHSEQDMCGERVRLN